MDVAFTWPAAALLFAPLDVKEYVYSSTFLPQHECKTIKLTKSPFYGKFESDSIFLFGVIQPIVNTNEQLFSRKAAAVKHLNCFSPADE